METRIIEQAIEVSFSYPVVFTRGLADPANDALRDALTASGGPAPARLLFVIDDGVAAAHPGLPGALEAYCRGPALETAAPSLVVAGGERAKNDPAGVERVREAIHLHGIDRHSYVVAVGGGAVVDMAGYAAATAHRGVRLVRVPTTVLAQNDSAVGVKNAVNAYGKKNFLGTFAPPHAVLCDLDLLATLSDRDWRAGISEAVKVALLKDPAFFGWIEERAADLGSRDADAIEWLVYRCAQLHLEHIATSGDPFELGSSRPLDFGHWAAHKLEQLSGFALRHGEAVALGIAVDATYSYGSGRLARADWERVLALLVALGLPVHTPEMALRGPDGSPRLLEGLGEFREHLGGRLTIMLLEGLGRGVEVHEMDEDVLRRSLSLLKRAARTGEERAWPTSPALAR